MKSLSSFAFLTAVLALGASAPAMAAWDRLGSVAFSNRMDRETEYGAFGGSIEKLAFEARNYAVDCREVRATFGNGQTKRIFRGKLPVGRSVTVDLPGDQRTVKRIDFNCKSNNRRDATVDISADIGRYQAEWRASPDWDRTWSKMFAWAHADHHDARPVSTGWMTLGTETFEGRRDRETTLAGFKGRHVERIGLRPTNDAARCRDMNVTFANGKSTRLSVNNGDVLAEDRIYQVDLPGDDRNVLKVDLNCRAEHGRKVTVEVMTIDPDRNKASYGRR